MSSRQCQGDRHVPAILPSSVLRCPDCPPLAPALKCGRSPAHGAGHRLSSAGAAAVRAGDWTTCLDCGSPIGRVPADVREAWRAVELARRMGGYAG